MAGLNNTMRRPARALVRGVIACACLLQLSCAFGNADAVNSLFEDNTDPLFVAVGSESGNYAIYTSPTGSAWTHNLVRAPIAGSLNCAMYGDGLFLAAGSAPSYFVSPDGYAWGNINTSGPDAIMDGVYGGGRYVVVGNDSSGHASSHVSEDGLLWSKNTLGGSLIPGTLSAVTYANGLFIAVGFQSSPLPGSGLVIASTDGIVWSGNLCPSSITLSLNDVAYGNGLFVAVGAGAETVVSADGVIWSKGYSIGTDTVSINGVSWGNGRFVAVGDPTGTGYGAIYLSEDGIVWSSNVNNGSAGTSSFQDVTSCHGYFVAVGLDGKIIYSRNGLSWNGSTPPSGVTMYGITCRP